jgi:hypothetical protein
LYSLGLDFIIYLFSPDLTDKVSCALMIFDEQTNRINNNIFFIRVGLEIGYNPFQ